jgi:hypothetical protein
MKNRITYEEDFAAWAEEQAALLRSGDLALLDRENLVDELEGMSNSQRLALGSHLRNVMIHMLKLQIQPEKRSRSWYLSIENARQEINDLLRTSPSLRRFLDPVFTEQYARARRNAAVQTKQPLRSVPSDPPFALSQVLGQEPFEPERIFQDALGE